MKKKLQKKDPHYVKDPISGKQFEESAEGKIKRLVGRENLEFCLNLYKQMREMRTKKPFPPELHTINEQLYKLYRQEYLTKKEASDLELTVLSVVVYGNRGRVYNLMHYEAIKGTKIQGGPDFPMTFFILALVAEIKAADNHINQTEIYSLVESYLYNLNEGIKIDVKTQYNRWKNRPEIIEYLNWFIQAGNMTPEIIAIRDHIQALQKNS